MSCTSICKYTMSVMYLSKRTEETHIVGFAGYTRKFYLMEKVRFHSSYTCSLAPPAVFRSLDTLLSIHLDRGVLRSKLWSLSLFRLVYILFLQHKIFSSLSISGVRAQRVLSLKYGYQTHWRHLPHPRHADECWNGNGWVTVSDWPSNWIFGSNSLLRDRGFEYRETSHM